MRSGQIQSPDVPNSQQLLSVEASGQGGVTSLPNLHLHLSTKQSILLSEHWLHKISLPSQSLEATLLSLAVQIYRLYSEDMAA